MAAGDILKEANLVVETFTVKTGESIEKGELVCDDGSGNGIVAATAALSVAEKVYMALEASTAADPATIECVVVGYVEAQKVSGSGAAQQGDKLMISGTAGEVTKFVKGAAPGSDTYNTATMQTALDTNARVVGTAMNTTLDATVTQKMLLGVIG